ncbi:hypothetical protein acsn021_35200 [Anaerocolumna cellulosilytica]|uniref:Uncharacterized protein n=1 Tax=Anaerocolumna cellulosilytica TaxID=433286 RepID=A0A6S6RAT5_9FIRM|nr:hypothetical protein [Anaerocolumna cellulosilytica]BCJ95951.1 hypothetical protein acsn021_35200 [Anaerocolumna cellulosilytica]
MRNSIKRVYNENINAPKINMSFLMLTYFIRPMKTLSWLNLFFDSISWLLFYVRFLKNSILVNSI